MMGCYGWIPRYVSGGAVLWVFELLRVLQRLRRRAGGEESRLSSVSGQAARDAYFGEPLRGKRYIEYQSRCAGIRFGLFSIAYSGCEIIALYNILEFYGAEHESFPELIAAVERDGMVLDGRWGSSPRAILRHLERRGFSVREALREPDFSGALKSYDSFLLTLYNDRDDIRRQIHTVCITREGGALCIHNAADSGIVRLSGDSGMAELTAAFPGGRAKPILLAGIAWAGDRYRHGRT
ncbi:hypothetical protein [Lachnoclostridium sp. Marseille-P6806]|uniref:hypothetical protein n=1 Tax=Lachnoclostridium sp. Marseille-P6806 TaxID=2364793 RepID=UPI00102F419C|nr:hypothetical protein [Lachnoclostridium sp. Marseille-P6806]